MTLNEGLERPAPNKGIKVCTICRSEPETCGHAQNGLTPDFLRKGCIWCCDWQPRGNTVRGLINVDRRPKDS